MEALRRRIDSSCLREDHELEPGIWREGNGRSADRYLYNSGSKFVTIASDNYDVCSFLSEDPCSAFAQPL